MEPVKTFIFVPYSKYKDLDSKAKKPEYNEVLPSLIDSSHPDENNIKISPELSGASKVEETKSQLGKDMAKTYRTVQMKKLLHHIEKTTGSEKVKSLENLEELIKTALSNTRKKLPNEELFFTFLFDNGMAHFVKNRSKIDLYYKDGLWYKV